MATEDLDVRDIYKSKFIVGEDLEGREHTCVIRKVGIQPMTTEDGGSENKLKLALSGFDKPLLLCKTEAQKLSRLLDEPKARLWVGATITIHPVRGRFFGMVQEVPRLGSKATRPPVAREPAREKAPPARSETVRQPGEDG